ncbi:AraC family transcriptional regulator [Roseateles sp.]|jgi:AraC-like DNA-binding protein|uniref:AraC family transcriptional regulator n=1 Tax=Roseateles sp. TaxID=1971397 RepID=UPI0037CB14F0
MPASHCVPPAHPSPDPLTQALQCFRLQGTLYCQSELSAPWGIEVPRMDGVMVFLVVTQGHCWLEVEGHPPQALQQGSLTLIPHGSPHRFLSALGTSTVPLDALPIQQVTELFETVRYGGGGAVVKAMYGVVRFDHLLAKRLVSQLPAVLQMDAAETEQDLWLHSTLRYIAQEAAVPKPGSETVVTRLADILVVQAIRAWLASAPLREKGWLAALSDERVGRAMALMHQSPQTLWTVDRLAKAVGMSRSAFSTRFSALTGQGPLAYLTEWRMQLARAWLSTSGQPIAHMSGELGYQSEAAFSRAFKQHYGMAPGSFRRHEAQQPGQAARACVPVA